MNRKKEQNPNRSDKQITSVVETRRKGTHINQFLAHETGISRREADKEIKSKRVTIDGKIALPPDMVLENSVVTWKGKQVKKSIEPSVTIALYKPVGYVSSRKRDETNAPTVMELLPKEYQRLKPIGRLDKESEGLLLFTNDGDLLYKSTHPKFETEKEYEVEFEAVVHDRLINAWLRGVKLPEGIAKADKVTRLSRKKLQVTLHQGMSRQIRRMAAEMQNTVISLKRIRSGAIKLGALKEGAYKLIEKNPGGR